jgi:hypothetical protein
MNSDLDTARGIINGILLSLPLWAVLVLVLRLLGLIG